MANTTRVEIGALKLDVNGQIASNLDAYNLNDSVFSVEDIPDSNDPTEAREKALSILANAISPGDKTLFGKVQALADAADALDRLTNKINGISPQYDCAWWTNRKMNYVLNALQWERMGGTEGLKRVAEDLKTSEDKFRATTVAFSQGSISGEELTGTFSDSYGTYVNVWFYRRAAANYPIFDQVFTSFIPQLSAAKTFFSNHQCNSGERFSSAFMPQSNFVCSGDGCPQESAVPVETGFMLKSINLYTLTIL